MARAPRSVDRLLEAAGVDPAAGIQVVSVDRLAAAPFDPGLPLLVLAATTATDDGGEPAVPGRHARRGPRAVLTALYPAEHRLRALPAGPERSVDSLDDAALRARDWFVPALTVEQNLASPHGMAAISARLRAPDGCPWDRRQDHRSLRPYLLEEAYETLDAIERGAKAFKRSILLIHGDEHAFTVGALRNNAGAPIPGVLNLMVMGDEEVDAVKVTVDPATPGVFGFAPGLLPR